MGKPDYSAKHKLNAAHFRGAFVVAGLIGLATQSPSAFAMALAIMVVLGILSGAIRK